MSWLNQHGWWGLFAIAVLLIVFGVTDIASGAAADPAIAEGLTGRSFADLEAEGAASFELYDFMSRVNGWSLVLIGILLATVIWIPFRRGERWAWWTAWVLPLWAAGVPVFYLVAGVAPERPPPPPMVSGPIVAVLCAAVLLWTRPRAERSERR